MPLKAAHIVLPGGILIAVQQIAHRGEVVALPGRVDQEHVGGILRVEGVALYARLSCLSASTYVLLSGLGQLLLVAGFVWICIELESGSVEILNGRRPLFGVLPQESAEHEQSDTRRS